jgi:hypothetical protein
MILLFTLGCFTLILGTSIYCSGDKVWGVIIVVHAFLTVLTLSVNGYLVYDYEVNPIMHNHIKVVPIDKDK